MKRNAIYIASLFLSFSSMAFAQVNGIGLGGLWYQSPYLGESNQVYPGPLIEYNSEHLFISGRSAGVHLWQNSEQQLNAIIQFQPLGLKPSDNDDIRMRQLDRRKPTLLAGISYSINAQWGQLKGEVLADVLDNSRSILIDLQYSYHLQLTDQFSLIPQIGTTWVNSDHNRYYYGVSDRESLRSGFLPYRPNDGITPYAGLTARYRFNTQWSALLGYQFALLSNDVKSSPIVNRSNIHGLTFALMYHF